ncbi:unnamed protein product [Orchesella dallaii]|uniref:Uncharacterized protein n=1 Tax=Orchesella dallaii TaxID=48710 RepID=A0ABP1QCT8_9HEXA
MQTIQVVLALVFVCAVNAAPQIFTSEIFENIPDEVELNVPTTEHTIILPPYFQNLLNNIPNLPPPPPVQFYSPSLPFQLQLGQHRLFLNWFNQVMALLKPSTTTTTTAAP